MKLPARETRSRVYWVCKQADSIIFQRFTFPYPHLKSKPRDAKQPLAIVDVIKEKSKKES